MKKKRFSEEQIIAVLKEAEAGAQGVETWRNGGRRAGSPPPLSVTLPVPRLLRSLK